MQNIGEATIAIPSTWFNNSLNIFTAEPPGRAGPSLAISRDRLRPGVTFDDYTREQLAALRGKLSGFEMASERQESVGGCSACLYDFTWRSERGVLMHQLLLSVLDEVRVMNLVVTHGAVMERSLHEQMVAMLLSLRFTRPDRPEPRR